MVLADASTGRRISRRGDLCDRGRTLSAQGGIIVDRFRVGVLEGRGESVVQPAPQLDLAASRVELPLEASKQIPRDNSGTVRPPRWDKYWAEIPARRASP